MALTKKQKEKLYNAGANDTYINEKLCEQAEEFIDDELGGFGKLSDEEYQEAVEIYSAGFYGEPIEEFMK